MIDVVIDNREQTPWHFPEEVVNARRGTLRTGDYALRGDLFFAIERKSFDDFLGTISSGWDRFCRELDRARDHGFVMPVIVEGRICNCLYSENRDGSITPPDSATTHPKLYPQFILKRIGEIFQRSGCVMFCDNPEAACAVAYSILLERSRHLEDLDRKNTDAESGQEVGIDESREGPVPEA